MPKLSLAFLVLLVIGAGCDASTAPAGAITSPRREPSGMASTSRPIPTRSVELRVRARRARDDGECFQRLGSFRRLRRFGSAVEPSLLTYVLTVPDLFDLIQDALDRKAVLLAVRYDPIYGYPTRIDIDYSADAVDDEVSMSARELTIQ
jgi:hypothetical protein